MQPQAASAPNTLNLTTRRIYLRLGFVILKAFSLHPEIVIVSSDSSLERRRKWQCRFLPDRPIVESQLRNILGK